MDQIHHIREMYFQQDKSISEIASETGLNRKTISKYVDMEDFNCPPPTPASVETHESKLDPFRHLIDEWLQADKLAPRKQRHTAKRVFKRLQEEAKGFNCSYRLVALYVAQKKKELRLKKKEGYLPLNHHPGEAQADFGFADFYENGKLHHEAKYLVLSFPYSNGGFLQLNYGENVECLLEGLVAMFEHIGGVPSEIWFDNTRTIVTGVIKGGGRNVTERFQRFCEHYRIKPVFMNPDAGWEKGNVENKVGYLRRNELVPVPRFNSLVEENKYLLRRCEIDMQREHYDDDDDRFISELFQEDKARLLPLPSVPFDTALYTTATTDKYGKFTLDSGKHRYSASPSFCETCVNLKITSSDVIVMDKDMHKVVRHKRLYGNEHERMDWLPYLTYIAKKPRSLRNSGIYDMMPQTMQIYMDNCETKERGRVLKVLAELTERTGFTSAVKTVNEALRLNAADPDSLQNLYRRTYADVPLLPPLENNTSIPQQKVIPFRNDLKMLDAALMKGGASNG
jgi:transposase